MAINFQFQNGSQYCIRISLYISLLLTESFYKTLILHMFQYKISNRTNNGINIASRIYYKDINFLAMLAYVCIIRSQLAPGMI